MCPRTTPPPSQTESQKLPAYEVGCPVFAGDCRANHGPWIESRVAKLCTRFHALDQALKEETTKEDNWKRIKQALTSTGQNGPGRGKHRHKKFISMETLNKIQERRNKKTAIKNSRTRTEEIKAQAKYPGANKQVKSSISVDKQQYVEALTATATNCNKREYETTI
ncbi:unnamed protein product [Schistosoma mattheei]|uniref:Uncharacterized protein n=1 Tax=Schistosoma mattheei TaxID=31246 RepID=A0A183P4H7_9TREM|nr:unnamed protein product [Schistosoma mattheei]